jgi:hypothetical protein
VGETDGATVYSQCLIQAGWRQDMLLQSSLGLRGSDWRSHQVLLRDHGDLVHLTKKHPWRLDLSLHVGVNTVPPTFVPQGTSGRVLLYQ